MRRPTVMRWIESMIEETGERGFHFVDEAAPPSLLGRLAQALLRRGLRIEWWENLKRRAGGSEPDA